MDGLGRLNPPFVEWMMGFDAGWATDLLGRTAALRVLGNSVVPQVADVACRLLLGDFTVPAAAEPSRRPTELAASL